MWLTVLLQAILFSVAHAAELIAAIEALFAFFKAHRTNPQLSTWVSEFSQVLTVCQETRNPAALQLFLERIRASIQEGK